MKESRFSVQVPGRIEVGNHVAGAVFQRIEVGCLMATQTIGRNQLQDTGFLVISQACISSGGRGQTSHRAKFVLDAQMTGFVCIFELGAVEHA